MQTVTHKIFGIGEVIAKEVKENDIYITVRFTSGKEMRLAVKSFEDGFVTTEGDLKEEIEKVISDKKVLESKKRADFIASTIAHTTAAAGHASKRSASSKMVVSGPIATAFEAYLINEGYSTETPSGHPSTVYSYISAIENDVLDEEHISWDMLKSNIDSILPIYDVGGKKEHIGAKSNYTVINALRRFAEFVTPLKEESVAIMDIKAFIGKDVIIEKTKTSCVLTEITAPYIQVQTKAPNSSGYPSTYRFETINGDPFTNNLLIFEDSTLLEPFMKAYKAYCHTKDAYYEEIGYWMRKD